MRRCYYRTFPYRSTPDFVNHYPNSPVTDARAIGKRVAIVDEWSDGHVVIQDGKAAAFEEICATRREI